ncbi:L-histidine N(alpha)-methyltransferase [Chryseobacterium sp. LAM-KRS1]|uniref:L-histidine N(alpha)-methyltransferase n=1 Tax=Chryseobacterium sp. LAM-KRS1 TaxID=2715754 RepID=UPI001557CC71|nr:L-histidine N(alpha)-methyltransferase [Chryseobacterium sp. LAM-KRS1]
MNSNTNSQIKNNHNKTGNFFLDVKKGLDSNPKRLSSKYFYDEVGDRLFQKIMAMPEYYLTQCELDIFQNKTADIANLIGFDNTPFDLIELGAGDAMKSTYLLKYMIDKGLDFTYMPIDISGNILSVLDQKLKKEIPDLKVTQLEGEYFQMLNKAASLSSRRKVILFLGGNIGNMELEEANAFCIGLKDHLNPGDRILIGFDLKKNPHTILNAYNDATGITAAFNLNLLTRINKELNADFNIEQFQHYQTYDPVSGACRSYLVSLADQVVNIDHTEIIFKENELIDMEVSQKFSETDIKELAKKTGFEIDGEIKDSRKWFIDSVWKFK